MPEDGVNNPLLYTLDPHDSEATKRVFGLARRLGEEGGNSPVYMNTRTVKIRAGTKVRRKGDKKTRAPTYRNNDALVVQWKAPGLSEEQFGQLVQIAQDIHDPYPIKERCDESGKRVRVSAYPTHSGGASKRQKGYFVGRRYVHSWWAEENGMWVTRDYRDSREARREMAKSGWLFGDGPHTVELREDDRLSQLTFLEYMARISSVLGKGKLLPRKDTIYNCYRELSWLKTPPKPRNSVVGLDEALDRVRWLLWSQSKNRAAAEHYGVESESPLLVGLPGTGKTLVAEVLLGENHEALFIPVTAMSLLESISESEGDRETLFTELDALQRNAGVLACFFCDDMEAAMQDPEQSGFGAGSLARSASFLNRLDGMYQNPLIKVAGTSNYPETIDPRIMRAGRIGHVVHIRLPDYDARVGTFEVHTRGKPLEGVRFRELGNITNGYVNADIRKVCNAAARTALQRAAQSVAKRGESAFDALPRVDQGVLEAHPITQDDFKRAVSKVGRRVRVEKNLKRDDEIAKFCKEYRGGDYFSPSRI